VPQIKPSASRLTVTGNGPIAPSDSEEDVESKDSLKPRHDRRTSKDLTRLSVPAEHHRKVSKESVRLARSFQASVEDAPPTPPQTPPLVIQEMQPAEQKHTSGQVSAGSSAMQTAIPCTDLVSDTGQVALPEKEDCNNHVHVVYIHPPCYHHGHVYNDQSSQDADKVRPRGRRVNSSTTTTSSKQSSRRVAFATPEVSSRHEADADYDRSAVPENHEDTFEFGLDSGSFRGNYDVRGSRLDGLPRRSPTPGLIPHGFVSSGEGSSSDYVSTPSSGSSRPRMDTRSPPPEYSAPPPKVFSPDEIRRLWEQGSQPVHPRRQQRQEPDRGHSGPAPARNFASVNRENFAANQRSASEGDYPRGYGDAFSGFGPSSHGERTSRLDNIGPSEDGRSDNRRGVDARYKNDENIDPKTRHNSSTSSRPSQPRSRDASSEQSANMYNNDNNSNQTNQYNNARSSQLHGPASSAENNPTMYNNDTNEYSSNHAGQSDGHARFSEDHPNMYNNQRSAPSKPCPSQSRSSSNHSENNRSMHDNHRVKKPLRTRPSKPSQPDEPRHSKSERSGDNSRQSSASPAEEAPFTARERMWTDNPEQARRLREAMERLERAAAANTPKTASAPESPPTPDIRVNNSPIPDFETTEPPNVSTPDFDWTKPGSGSDKRGFNSADFGSTKPGFTSSTRNFSSADFGSSMPQFGSDTRNFTSGTAGDFSSASFGSDTRNFSNDTRNFTSRTGWRDFSPNVPSDYAPPRPSGFTSSSSTPPRFCPRNTASSAATWEHPCGPFCNEFCPDRADHVAREIVEIDSDEEREILRGKGSKGSSKKGSKESLRRASSDRAFRLALVRLRRHDMVAADAAAATSGSPAKSVGSDYYTASESSCY